MIKINSVKFNNEFRPSQDLTFLLSCIGEKVNVKIGFYYEDITFCTPDNLITLKPDLADIDLSDNTGIILSADNQAFANTYVGDSIGVYTGAAFNYYTVLEKFDNGMIRTDYAGIKTDLADDDYIFNSTPFNGVRFIYNLVDSGANYNSLIDGELQQLTTSNADCTNVTPQSMVFTGIKSYQIGSATITGTGGTGGGMVVGEFVQQTFEIEHNTVITPFFLTDQFTDLQSAIKPDYFDAEKCLNYIAKIQLGRSLNNPNGLQTLEIPTYQSNVGWFNEMFNGGQTNYSIFSKSISPGTKLQFGIDNTITIVIENTTDAPFVSGQTKTTFGFNYLPNDEQYYQNNGFNQKRNFLFDSKNITTGSGPQNGDDFGGTMQVIKTVSATVLSPTKIQIVATINFGTDAEMIMDQNDSKYYQIWAITENHALDADKSDKTNLLCYVTDIYEQKYSSNSLVFNYFKHIAHPFDSDADGINGADFHYYPVDDIVSNLKFTIDYNPMAPFPLTGTKINKVKAQIYLKQSGNPDIVLEENEYNVSLFPIINNQEQNIDFEQDRIFKIPSNEIRKKVIIKRDFASDSGDIKAFKINYPFMIRWEYWVELILDSIPGNIFNNALPFNGVNEFWERLATTGFDLYNKFTFTLEQNGVEFEQTIESVLEYPHNYDENADWTNNSIKSYDINTNAEITSGGNRYVYGYQDVRIEALFKKTTGPIPTLSNVEMVIWIETYELGGVSDIRRISSVYTLDSQSWFKSIDNSNKVVITTTGNEFKGVAILDHTKLPNNKKFTIYARLYEKDATPVVVGKQFQNGNNFEFMNGNIYQFQMQ